MTVLDTYWAKSPAARSPKGELLTAHLLATYEVTRTLALRIGTIECLVEPVRSQFWRIVELAAILHDAGKIADGFQRMLKGQIRVWPQRHEALSLGFVRCLVDDAGVRPWVSAAVATHHRPLTEPRGDGANRSLTSMYGPLAGDEFAEEIGELSTEAAAELVDWIAATAGLSGDRSTAGIVAAADTAGIVAAADTAGIVAAAYEELMLLLTRWSQPADPATGLAAVLLQGAVTLSDHLSSAHGVLDAGQPVDQRFRARVLATLRSEGRSIRPHQRQAASHDGHLILRAPTGSGKTESGMLWATGQLQRIADDRRCVPRLFYTLPYLASINAMTRRLGDDLGDDRIGVAHSRAGSYHLAVAIGSADGGSATDRAGVARKAHSRKAATRLFRETVRVGTPYQLLRGALAGPAHAGVLLDSANSVFLLDELHAYDTRRLGFILAAMSFWERLGGSIGVLSATMPDALLDLIRTTLTRPVAVIDGHGHEAPARHRIHLREQHLTDESSIDEIRRALLDGLAVAVVANNVADARDLFAALSGTAEEIHGPDGAHLLHSRFRRRDRDAIEEAIMARYGTGATRRGGLVVATQAIEVSLDLDFDTMHTSGASLEALIQRSGRVNRLGLRPPASVMVHQPSYGTRRTDGVDAADGIYPAEPTRHAWDILSRHEGQPVNERTTVDWLNEIYASEWGATWRKEVEDFRQAFAEGFLMFTTPFEDRDRLAKEFDKLFDGCEAVLTDDLDEYRALLDEAPGAAGRLLAEDLLIPLPHYSRTFYDKELRVHRADAEYDPRTGLGAARTATGPTYRAGEIL